MSLVFGFAAEDIIKEGRITRTEIDAIRTWNPTQDIPILMDEQIVSFLLSCDRDEEFTKKTIVEYFKARERTPEIFNDRDVSRPDFQLQLKTLEYFVLPKKTPDGCIIVYHKLYEYAYYNYNMGPSMCLLSMTLDAALQSYPPTGLITLFDMKGVGLAHLTRIKLYLIKAFIHYIQEGLPVKLKAIHVFNTVRFLDKILFIVKPFVNPKIYDMLHFHDCNLDMEMFYQNHIPKECLPNDYGGDQPDTRTLHGENTKRLMELKPFFDAEERQRRNVTR